MRNLHNASLFCLFFRIIKTKILFKVKNFTIFVSIAVRLTENMKPENET